MRKGMIDAGKDGERRLAGQSRYEMILILRTKLKGEEDEVPEGQEGFNAWDVDGTMQKFEGC